MPAASDTTNVCRLVGPQISPVQLAVVVATQGEFEVWEKVHILDAQLEDWPGFLHDCHNLSELIMKGNTFQFSTLELREPHFLNLTRLVLSGNNLTSLPAQFLQLKHLQHLDVSHNQLVCMPPFFPHCHNLLLLNVSHNRLEYLPSWFNRLWRTRILDFSDNPLREEGLENLNEDFGKKCRCLREFSMTNCSINADSLPPTLIGSKDNMVIRLGSYSYLPTRNVITSLDGISQSLGLREIVAPNMNIQEIPSDIGKLKYLRHMDLSTNSLKDLPSSMADLMNLEYLDVSGNYLQSLYYGIENCRSLTVLKVSSNKLSWVTEKLWKLQNLVELDLYNNNLDLEGIEGLEKMSKVSLIDLGNNEITAKDIRNLHMINYMVRQTNLRIKYNVQEERHDPRECPLPQELHDSCYTSENFEDTSSASSNCDEDYIQNVISDEALDESWSDEDTGPILLHNVEVNTFDLTWEVKHKVLPPRNICNNFWSLNKRPGAINPQKVKTVIFEGQFENAD